MKINVLMVKCYNIAIIPSKSEKFSRIIAIFAEFLQKFALNPPEITAAGKVLIILHLPRLPNKFGKRSKVLLAASLENLAPKFEPRRFIFRQESRVSAHALRPFLVRPLERLRKTERPLYGLNGIRRWIFSPFIVCKYARYGTAAYTAFPRKVIKRPM